MGEQKENKVEATIDLNNYVPKTDFEKTSSELTRLKEDADKLKLQLLDPKYIEFLEAQRNPKKKDEPNFALFDDLKPEDIDRLPNSKVIQLAEKVLGEKIIGRIKGDYDKEIGSLRQVVGDVLIKLELDEVVRNNPDWKDNEKAVEEILRNSNSDLTIQQALDLARYKKSQDKSKDDKKEEKSKQNYQGSEKPTSSIPAPGMGKTFKNEKEAGRAAWDSVKEKYGLSSDIL